MSKYSRFFCRYIVRRRRARSGTWLCIDHSLIEDFRRLYGWLIDTFEWALNRRYTLGHHVLRGSLRVRCDIVITNGCIVLRYDALRVRLLQALVDLSSHNLCSGSFSHLILSASKDLTYASA